MTKKNMQFSLVAFSIVGLFALAWFKGTDISMLLPTVLGMFVLGHTATNVSSAWALSKDANADTAQGINDLEKH